MRVTILGCGPAGLMAAHAATEMGCEVTVLSRKQKSPLYGAQYLHRPIPDMTDRDKFVDVEYRLIGDTTAYRRKVYGPQWDGTVSPEDLGERHTAWDIRETYDNLWAKYEGLITDTELDPAGVRFLSAKTRNDLLINSVPMKALCHRGHQFRAQEVVAAGDAPNLGIDVGTIYHSPPDTVTCNGEEMPTWYRLSRIFDHTTVEWPGEMAGRVPVPTAAKVIKPLDHNCDCWPKMINVGRYGSWEKGILSHTAYYKTLEVLDGKTEQAARYTNPDMPTLF